MCNLPPWNPKVCHKDFFDPRYVPIHAADEWEPQVSLGRSNTDRRTLIYGIAHFGKSLFWYTSELLLAFYLSEVCGLTPQTMGIVLAAGFALGACADLGFAWRLSPHIATAAAAARMQLAGAGLSAVCLSAMFLVPEVPIPFRVAYAFATGLAFRIAYVLYDIPQNALVSLGTTDDDSRSRVSALRILFSGLASLGVGLGAIVLLMPGLAPSRAERFFVMGIAWSLVAIATAVALARVDWRTAPPPAPTPHPATAGTPAQPLSLLVLLAIAFIVSATASIFAKTEPYYMSYVLRNATWGGLILSGMSVGSAVSPPVWGWLALRYSRRVMLVVTAVALAVSALIFWWVGLWPVAALAAAFLFGVANGGVGVVLWAAFGDAVKASDRLGAGLAFGIFTAVMKLALAVGILGLGLALSALDYRTQGSDWLLAPMCGVPAAGGALVLLVLFIGRRKTAVRGEALSYWHHISCLSRRGLGHGTGGRGRGCPGCQKPMRRSRLGISESIADSGLPSR